jgi:hypothetical protein
MSMNMGWAEVTLAANAAGSTGTATWNHPARIAEGYSSAAADAIELDAAPLIVLPVRQTAPGGAAGIITYTATATGVTLTSTHVNETGVFRVYAFARPLPPWWQA